MVELKATITFERMIHDALWKLIDKVSRDHGIQVDKVSVNWIQSFGMSPLLHSIECTTTTITSEHGEDEVT